jgi:hypothetical protein
MRNYLIVSTLPLLALLVFLATGCSGRFETADQEAAKAVPDLSGIWEAPNDLNALYASGGRSDLCGEGACEEVLKLKPFQLVITLEEPQMLPWAGEIFKTTREEGSQDPNAPREDADPWFSACMPLGPSRSMLSPWVAFELRQFPDVVLLFYGDDHAVRRVYLDGRGHPASFKPTWMGHSIGRYDGDTLVVDTIGINDKSWVDLQGHPHSDALHLEERIRRVNQNSLEVEVTIDDPKAYKNSWRKKIVRQMAPSGPRIWDDVNCSELLQMGTHYSAEARK